MNNRNEIIPIDNTKYPVIADSQNRPICNIAKVESIRIQKMADPQPKNKATRNDAQKLQGKSTHKRVRAPLHIYNPGNFTKHDTSNVIRQRSITKSPLKKSIMPIIVKTVSLCPQNKIHKLGISSEVTIKRATDKNRTFNHVDWSSNMPDVTITNSKGEIQKLPFMKKPVVTIDLDEEDEVVQVIEMDCDSDLIIKGKVKNFANPSKKEILNIEIEDSSDFNIGANSDNTQLVSTNNELNINKKSSDISVIISDEEDVDNEPILKTTSKTTVNSNLIEEEVKERNESETKVKQSKETINETITVTTDVCDNSVMPETSPSENEKISGSKQENPSTSNSVANENEFVVIFDTFLQLCAKLDETEQMKSIINKRLVKGYKSTNPKYTNSKYFKSFIERNMKNMSDEPNCLFIYIKQVVDELKAHKMTVKPKIESDNEGTDVTNDDTSMKISKLEKDMSKLNKKIKKLEEQEVGPEDDDDSAYLRADKYKARLVNIYSKLCKLKGKRSNYKSKLVRKIMSKLSLETIKIPSLFEDLKTLLISKKNIFPDLYDIINCMKMSALKDKVKISSARMDVEARSIFLQIGNEIQKYRKLLEYKNLCEYIEEADDDPADHNSDLEAKLNEHKKIYIKKEKDLLHSYVLRESNCNEGSNSENEEEGEEGKPKKNEVQLINAIVTNFDNTFKQNNTVTKKPIPMEVDIPKVEDSNSVSFIEIGDLETNECKTSVNDSVFENLYDSDVEFVM